MSRRLVVLAATPNDFLDWIKAHPEHTGKSITATWPWHLESLKSNVFDEIAITPGFKKCPRWEIMAASAMTRVRPAVDVFVSVEHAKLMGLGGPDA